MFRGFSAIVFLFFICLGANAAAPDSGTMERNNTGAEARYFNLRAPVCRSAEKMPGDYEGIEKLEQPLRSLIGTVSVPGFPGRGSVSNEPEMDGNPCDVIEGLAFDNAAQERLFVTTKGLLDNYLRRHPKMPRQPEKLFRSDDFYFAAIKADVALANYGDVPVRKGAGQEFAYAFLGGFAQDIGPFIPDTLIVVVAAKNHVYMMSAPLRKALTGIPACQKIWDDYSAKADALLDKYKESNNTNDKLYRAYSQTQYRGFVAYCTCFGKEAQSRPYFPSVVQHAESLVNRLPMN